MNTKRSLKDIGRKLREEARDIVEAKLPERLTELVRKLEIAEAHPLPNRAPCCGS